jgi:DNA (cytosine-5)-methyltransferase 1
MNTAKYARGAVLDFFCGFGGASLGLTWAGLTPDAACNHDHGAIVAHELNHRSTIHLEQSVWDVQPKALLKRLGKRHVDVLWASPDCTHFSRAKGAAPRSERVRMLAHVLVEWARAVRPRCIMMENVEEFVTWGPLDSEGHPIRERAGENFAGFVAGLRLCGYHVDWRSLVAANYGAPTTRKRFYLIARLDGPPVWPTPTHANHRAKRADLTLAPWRAAAECIDFDQPVLSVFATRDEAKAFAREHGCGVPQRPLSDKTMRRIAEGIRRYVVERPPYIVNGAAHMLIQTGYGERAGQRPRVLDIEAPLGTAVAGGGKAALVTAFLTRYYGGPRSVVGRELTEPVPTVTTVDHNALVAVTLLNLSHGGRPEDIADPARTITSTPKGGDRTLVAATLVKLYGTSSTTDIDEPLHTVTSGGGKHALVAALLVKYYGSGGQWSDCGEPMDTIVTKARMGLVTITLEGEPWVIVDIGLRMLTPRELARANGCPEDFLLTGTKEQQIRRIGNMAIPQVVRAMAACNMGLSR